MSKSKLLLHTCCACCGLLVPEILSSEYDVTLFYFNPNIYPENEYQRRLNDLKFVLSKRKNLKLIEPEYNQNGWLNFVKGYENEKEGGRRCELCFEYRLDETAKFAKINNFDIFCTTLTVGRNKKADIINPIGEKVSAKYNIEFFHANFKKNSILDNSCRLSDLYGIVRQNYCGCIFSLNESKERE